MKQVYIFNNELRPAESLILINQLLQQLGKLAVNPLIHTIPDDATIEDFDNGVFSQTKYEQRLERERKTAYRARVKELIRQRYDIEDELEVLREQDSEALAAHNEYVESCKAIAREEFGL